MDQHKEQKWIDFPLTVARVAPTPVEAPYNARLGLEPTARMRRAKAFVEEIQCPPKPDKHLVAMNGWLCPQGQLYGCAWKNHDELTTALGYRHESEIEEAGFCKLSRLEWLVEPRYRTTPLTEAQWKTISNWYEKNGFPDEHYLRLTAKM